MNAQHSDRRAKPLVLTLLCIAAAQSTVLSQTATFTPSKDNTIYQSTNPAIQESNGRGLYFFAGRTGQSQITRGLLAFDLSSIPTNATITSATLTLFDSTPKSSAATVSLRKVSRDWGEGTSDASEGEGGGAPATTGDATWLFNFFNSSLWTTSGGDYDAATSASIAVNATGRNYSWSGSGVVADVQGWVANPATNFGWGVFGNETGLAHRFNSSENSDDPPQLAVTYQLPSASPPQLLNISTRMRVETGDNALIGGFIVTGEQPKRVILRAIGPSLTQRGVVGALADPTLELRAPDGSVIMANDNWRENQQTEIQNSGVPPENDLEAAIVATLPAGGSTYTAIVRGKSDTTGVGLVEAYDLEQAADSRLANISTRGLVQTGSNVMIGGFIVGGSGNARVVIRGIGPSLTQRGVANPLADPTLELFDSNGTRLETNDNWRDDPDQAEIAATGLAPQNDLESALLANIPPGQYTGIVAGKNSGTGIGVVEVYHLR